MSHRKTTPSVHSIDEIQVVDATLRAVRFTAALRTLVIEIEIGASPAELWCTGCYWFEQTKTFTTPEAAALYMHNAPEEPDAASDIWDYAELPVERSPQLRHWRGILGATPLRHIRISTGLETLDFVCEHIEARF